MTVKTTLVLSGIIKPAKNRTLEFMIYFKTVPRLSVFKLVDVNGNKYYMMKVFSKYMINIQNSTTYKFRNTNNPSVVPYVRYNINNERNSDIVISEWSHKQADITLR